MNINKLIFSIILTLTLFIVNHTIINAAQLGGLKLGAYCQSISQTSVALSGQVWSCQPSGTVIDMNLACQWQYNSTSTAQQLDTNNPYTWQCFGDLQPTPPPTGAFIRTEDGYNLYDDGLNQPPPTCSPRKTNLSGISLQQNGKYLDLRWKGFTLATIAPLDDNPNSQINGVAINESSQVIGYYYNNHLPRSAQGDTFIWSNGIYNGVGQRGAGGAPNAITDINDKGYYVGFNSTNAFVYGNLASVYLSGLGYYTFPSCIDENNRILGTSIALTDSSNPQYHNVHWEPVSPIPDKKPLVPFVAEYFDNQNLEGTPKITRLDPKINISTSGTVDSSLPADRFSARWSKTQNMKSGLYKFTLKADDGIRFWVDDVSLVDDWNDHSMKTYTPSINLNAGPIL